MMNVTRNMKGSLLIAELVHVQLFCQDVCMEHFEKYHLSVQ